MFLLLTKRPSNINKYIPDEWKSNPPRNVMFGTSPCNKETFDTLWPQLAQVNGMTFLSIEPQIGRVDIKDYRGRYPDWVICGGESGHGRRPFDTDWGRVLKNQCEFLGIPFFMKQIDKVIPIPDDLMIRQFAL
jgi:protein gp37